MLYGKLSMSIRALVMGSEPLMKSLTIGQHRLLEGVTSLGGHKRDVDESVISARWDKSHPISVT